jgi:hypothetical protein
MIFFEYPEKIITSPEWNDGKVLIYKNKIVVQRLCCDKRWSYNYRAFGIVIFLIINMIVTRFSGMSISLAFFLFLLLQCGIRFCIGVIKINI